MTTTTPKPTARKIQTAATAALATRDTTLAAMAQKLNMRFLKASATRCAFASDEQVFIYDLDARFPLGRSWTPGRCMATLNRNDSDTATLEALGRLMVQG